MNGLDFPTTAERLGHESLESDWRSAISRAYYAVFHHVRELLFQHGLNLGRSGQAHFNLYAGMLHCGFPAAAALATRIDDLRSLRITADYDLHNSVGQKLALDTAQSARTFITDFQAFLQSVSPVQFVTGARKHLQTIGKIVEPP